MSWMSATVAGGCRSEIWPSNTITTPPISSRGGFGAGEDRVAEQLRARLFTRAASVGLDPPRHEVVEIPGKGGGTRQTPACLGMIRLAG